MSESTKPEPASASPSRVCALFRRARRAGAALARSRWPLPVILCGGLAFALILPALSQSGLLTNIPILRGWEYYQFILITTGISIILTASLNLVNGYMGEFSIGHAGLMAVGAYTSSILTVAVFPPGTAGAWLFALAVVAGGAAAALLGLLVALPSFKTRGDYLAIVTLAFGMIVKSALENINAVGGASGYSGMENLTSLPWVIVWAIVSLWMIRNFVYSKYGRGALAVREDEIAAELSGVNTRRVKLLGFTLSSFCAGVAGALFAHQILSITPRAFDLGRSTEILLMVYLGGIASIAGSILGGVCYVALTELLRSALGMVGHPEWRMAFLALLLILLMLFRPRGIMGLRELGWFVPRKDLVQNGIRESGLGLSQTRPTGPTSPTGLTRPTGQQPFQEPLLRVIGLTHYFGGLCAVSDFSLDVNADELIGIIGPNGAGKTTVFNLLTGVYRPARGSIRLDGVELSGLRPEQIVQCGVARTFQNIRLFRQMTVLDNVRVAHYGSARYGPAAAIARLGRMKKEEERIRDESLRLLARFGLETRAWEEAGSLPYGMQRRLEIARALAARPRLLLLDEPAAGMNPNEINELMEFIQKIRTEFGLTILLIEHQMRLVMGICERIKVLDFGATIAEGTPREIQNHPKVLEAYLGEEDPEVLR
ncbi:MAG: branched-chain amino acid ABC transporter ATP-binding protein/permease [Candidatus Sumerlaeota bacterium]|nr:branched-chain amino acid ABC transporter ATP-binding protein/permease [Candidatus Sumerlaeota bacterium]